MPYLKALGITPSLCLALHEGAQGSTHGYDIVDHTKLNPELGGEAGFARLSAALKQHDLGLILDFVPNHVGVHFADNPWWLDVLEWGPASPHAASFDIDWEQLPYRARGGVLLPIIGSSYGAGAGERRDRTALRRQRRQLLRLVLRASPADRAGALQRDPADHRQGSGRRGQRGRQGHSRARLTPQGIAPSQSQGSAWLQGGAEIDSRAAPRSSRGGWPPIAPATDRPAQTLALHHLLERQHYRLGHWRLASSDINYRRFFDVNTLAGLRVEDAGTFEAIHRLVRRLIADGQLQGLRLDHIDGLRDPAQYFQRLRRLIRRRARRRRKPFYMVVEKILGEHEKLPAFSGVHGTTGYEWMNVDHAGPGRRQRARAA